jgi:hypothetical protein
MRQAKHALPGGHPAKATARRSWKSTDQRKMGKADFHFNRSGLALRMRRGKLGIVGREWRAGAMRG